MLRVLRLKEIKRVAMPAFQSRTYCYQYSDFMRYKAQFESTMNLLVSSRRAFAEKSTTWNIHFIWWQCGLKQRGFNSTACHRFAIYSGYLDGIELCVLADQ
jgi:hypothetical protein